MDIKVKCTQCGCEDLEEVDFPFEAELIMTEEGISGEATFYDLENKVYTSTYICTRCGHFEFFNSKLAKLILKERQEKAALQSEIDKWNAIILEKVNALNGIAKDIEMVAKRLEDLDITISQSNELKAKREELEERKRELQKEKNALEKQRDLLRRKMQRI